jgi:hypothetical protein
VIKISARINAGFEGKEDLKYLMDGICREISIRTGSKQRVTQGSTKKRRPR